MVHDFLGGEPVGHLAELGDELVTGDGLQEELAVPHVFQQRQAQGRLLVREAAVDDLRMQAVVRGVGLLQQAPGLHRLTAVHGLLDQSAVVEVFASNDVVLIELAILPQDSHATRV